MRMTLRSVGLLFAIAATTVVPTGSLHAVEQAKGKTASPKGKTTTAAEKSPAKSPAQAVKAEPAAGKRLAASATPKTSSAPAAAAGKTTQTAVKTRQELSAAPAARKGKPAIVVAKAERVPAARSRSGTVHPASPEASHSAQKRHLTRALANSADLWQDPGRLAVQSGSALVIGQDAGELLYEKNASAVVPIASITKLMTAMVVLDSLPNLQAPIAIGDEDVDYLRGSRSRLGVGTVISRETALLLALMSSENRASHALARHYPGGLQAFVAAMNRKATSLGMANTRFEDPTGLSSNNVSTAHDLARMVAAAHRYPLIREFSTTPGVRAEVKGRELDFHNTNQLVSSPTWEIGLSKTGYIQEAGKCLVMQARVADKPVVIVLLDSAGKQTRIGDANRIKRWMESASAAGKLPTTV